MKGYFTIAYDYYTEELSFGKLGENGGLGQLPDALTKSSRIGALVAHDVIEHSVAHRTNKYLTYEQEIRALGACSFVRSEECFNWYSEILGQCSMSHRGIEPVPRDMGKFLLDEGWVNTGLMRSLIINGISPGSARNATYQFGWGEYQKTQQFECNCYQARYAFNFIEKHIKYALEEIWEQARTCSGVSVYFDTVMQIFRWTFKRNI